jgi:ABC-2 type transport system permease protein
VQAIILIVLGVVFFQATLLGALIALPFALGLAVLFVSIGLFIGSFFTSYEGFNLVMSFLTFPAVFLSGAFYPVDKLPQLLSLFVFVDPATYAVDGLRGALLGPHAFPYAVDVGVLLTFIAAFLAAGVWAFRRMQ